MDRFAVQRLELVLGLWVRFKVEHATIADELVRCAIVPLHTSYARLHIEVVSTAFCIAPQAFLGGVVGISEAEKGNAFPGFVDPHIAFRWRREPSTLSDKVPRCWSDDF